MRYYVTVTTLNYVIREYDYEPRQPDPVNHPNTWTTIYGTSIKGYLPHWLEIVKPQ